MSQRRKLNPHATAFTLYQQVAEVKGETREFEIGVAMLGAYFECSPSWAAVSDKARKRGWDN